jgi:carboxymethylenebutenolidase
VTPVLGPPGPGLRAGAAGPDRAAGTQPPAGELVVLGPAVSAWVQRAAAPAAPVVLLLPSWWGLTGHFRAVAGRLAAAGLSTVAVDLFDGQTTDDPARARSLRRALSEETLLARAGAGLAQAAQLAPGAGRPGLLGFSMGGDLAIRLAAAAPAAVAAAVAFYGVVVPPDLVALTAPLQLHLATDDEFATADEVGELAAAWVAHGKALDLHTYPGTRHAFFNPTRPEAYDETAAQLSWDRTVAFLHRHLDPAPGSGPAGVRPRAGRR